MLIARTNNLPSEASPIGMLRGKATFDAPHLAGRYITDVASGLGAIGGSLLAQEAVLNKSAHSCAQLQFPLAGGQSPCQEC